MSEALPELSLEEVAALPPATSHIRHWAGVTPLRPGPDAEAPPVPKEPHESDYHLFRHFDDAACLALDVGANVGQSVLSVRSVATATRLLCFEPNPVAFAQLEVVARHRGPAVALNVGLGDQVGDNDFWVPVIDGLLVTPLGTSVVSKLTTPGMRDWLREMAGGRPVQVTRLSIRTVPGDILGLRPDIVKIDVEGHEPACVRGLRQTLVDHQPVVMFEQNREAASELQDLGYQHHAYDATADVLLPLGPVGELQPQHLPLNLVAVHPDSAGRLRQRGLRVG